MLALAELQSRFRDTVLGAGADGLEGVVAADRIGHARRLNVYRNNTTILLCEALATNFPVTAALVGEDFFANTARTFVRTHPPRNPCLFTYGAAFAAFLKTFPGLQELPYLADVARLEWARNEAVHAADADVLRGAELSAMTPDDYARLTFAVHPATRVVVSPYPIFSIWALHQPDADPHAGVDLNQGGEAVLITRPGADADAWSLGRGEADFIGALATGVALGDAFAAAHAAHDRFDAAHALGTLLLSGALSAFTLNA